MSASRTKNAVRNIYTGILGKLLNIVLPFVSRTAILYLLGSSYLGIGTLFTALLSFLSLTELGFSTAITYALYKPVAENDYGMINAILKYFRRLYLIIGGIILVIGSLLVPFLPYLIKGDLPSDLNIYVLFYIYLINSVISYFISGYRQCILTAYQRSDVTNNIGMLIHLFNNVGQVIVLALTRNYYIFAIVPIIGTIIQNISNAFITRKMYPQIYCEGEISEETRKEIKKNLSGLFGTKLNSIVVHQADTIVISAFIGITTVAQYGNYYYVMNAVSSIIILIFGSITAGVGNKIVTDTKGNCYALFKKLSFLNNWIVGWCSVCFICLYQEFMKLWVGEELLLDFKFVALFVFYFWIKEIQRVILTFKDAAGLWYQDRYRPYLCMTFNIVCNLVLVHFIGIYGIVISSIVAFLISVPWINAVVYKCLFKKSGVINIISILRAAVTTFIIAAITYLICELLEEGVVGFIWRIIICMILPNVLFVIAFRRKEEFEDLIKMMKTLFNKITLKKSR